VAVGLGVDVGLGVEVGRGVAVYVSVGNGVGVGVGCIIVPPLHADIKTVTSTNNVNFVYIDPAVSFSFISHSPFEKKLNSV
jgi:hypothetical protein